MQTRLRDLSKTLPRFRYPAKIFRDPRFSRYHSPPLMILWNGMPHDLKNGIILRDAINVEWFKIFKSQNPEFKILDGRTVLNSRLLFPKGLNSKFWNARTPEFKISDCKNSQFKILDRQNSQLKILDRQNSRSRFWIAKILDSRLCQHPSWIYWEFGRLVTADRHCSLN